MGRGYITRPTLSRIRSVMLQASLPLYSPLLTLPICLQALDDAVEHRHGEQRVPLVTAIGDCVVVSDVREEELRWALGLIEEEEGGG